MTWSKTEKKNELMRISRDSHPKDPNVDNGEGGGGGGGCEIPCKKDGCARHTF